MSKEQNTTISKNGIGFGGLLTIVFIILKLTNVIAWSWLWVLAPLWIGVALSILGIILMVLGVMLAKKWSKKWKRKTNQQQAAD